MRTSAVWTRTSKASEEIIVTTQKWEQSANTVGMSITAATDEVLREHLRTWASFRHSQSTQIQGA
jgi:hypothetical protein